MLDLNSARYDAARIERGVWWAIHVTADRRFGGKALRGDPGDEPALLIRPADVEWERACDAARAPYLRDVRLKELSPADNRKVLAKAMAKALWRGANKIAVGGKEFEWSEAAAEKMLAEPEWWALQDFIWYAAQDRAALAAEEEAKASGN